VSLSPGFYVWGLGCRVSQDFLANCPKGGGRLAACGARAAGGPAAPCTPTVPLSSLPRSDERLLQSGGSGLLDRALRSLLTELLPTLRPALPPPGTEAGAPGGRSDLPEPSALPSELSSAAAVGAWGIQRPSTSDPEAAWVLMVAQLVLCCAGLVGYLMDCWPSDDMAESDPDWR
jgi:hypothetical protein